MEMIGNLCPLVIIITGTEQATSQLNYASSVEGQQGKFVLNFPIEATFKSSCPCGWPRLVLCSYGQDGFGKSIVRGYGAVPLPLTQGRHHRSVALFTPEASSELQQLANWFMNRRPEFADPRFVAQADSREVTRVSTRGLCHVEFNIITKDMKTLGYDNNARSVHTISDFPIQLTSIEPVQPIPVQQPSATAQSDDISRDDSQVMSPSPPPQDAASSSKLETLQESHDESP